MRTSFEKGIYRLSALVRMSKDSGGGFEALHRADESPSSEQFVGTVCDSGM